MSEWMKKYIIIVGLLIDHFLKETVFSFFWDMFNAPKCIKILWYTI